MRTLTLIVAAILIIVSVSFAGEIAIYEDKSGAIVISDQPAPEKAKVKHILKSKENTAAEVADYEARQKAITNQRYRQTIIENNISKLNRLQVEKDRQRQESWKEFERGEKERKTKSAERELRDAEKSAVEDRDYHNNKNSEFSKRFSERSQQRLDDAKHDLNELSK